MALAVYLIDFPSKGQSKTTKIVHGQKELNEHKKDHDVTMVSQLKKGKWTPPLTAAHEQFETWEK